MNTYICKQDIEKYLHSQPYSDDYIELIIQVTNEIIKNMYIDDMKPPTIIHTYLGILIFEHLINIYNYEKNPLDFIRRFL